MPVKYISEDESIRLLNEEQVGHLATATSTGAPYITPLHFVYHQGSIFIHSGQKGRKLDIIAENDQVCFAVNRVEKTIFTPQACTCTTRYYSVLVFGRAQIVTDLERKVDALTALTTKFAEGQPFHPISKVQAASCAVIEIKVDSIDGKRNCDPEEL